MSAAKKYISTAMFAAEAARALNRSEQTIRSWADAGRLPVYRTANGTRVFLAKDVDEMRRQLDQRDQDQRDAAALCATR